MARSERAGVEAEPYGDALVWVSVRGVSRDKNQAEVTMSIAQARKLAMQILHAASVQQVHLEDIEVRDFVDKKKPPSAKKK